MSIVERNNDGIAQIDKELSFESDFNSSGLKPMGIADTISNRRGPANSNDQSRVFIDDILMHAMRWNSRCGMLVVTLSILATLAVLVLPVILFNKQSVSLVETSMESPLSSGLRDKIRQTYNHAYSTGYNTGYQPCELC